MLHPADARARLCARKRVVAKETSREDLDVKAVGSLKLTMRVEFEV